MVILRHESNVIARELVGLIQSLEKPGTFSHISMDTFQFLHNSGQLDLGSGKMLQVLKLMGLEDILQLGNNFGVDLRYKF